MLLVFEIFFSLCNIADQVYKDWRLGGVGGCRGGWEAKGGLKQPFGLKEQCCTFSTDTIHKGGPDSHEEQFDTPCRTMKCTLVV